MDSQNQFVIFCLCVMIGIVGGVAYEPFSFIRLVFKCHKEKNKIVGYIADVLYCLFFTIFSMYAAYLFHFPAFRGYMLAGYLIGLIIYLKIFHRIVAFFEKVCYNSITKLVKKAKKQEKTLKKEVD